jgi:lauroyl/myristoyl acyltransferase
VKAIATTEIRRSVPAPRVYTRSAPLRSACAGFWLNLFFWTAEHSPLITRAVKWFFLFFATHFSQRIRGSTHANARHLLGHDCTPRQRDAFMRSVVGNFFDFVADVGLSLNLTREEMLERVEATEGEEHYDAARALRRGAIVLTAHMGSFEVGIAALLQRDPRVHVVFRRDEIPRFERLRGRLRRQLGVIEEPVNDGDWTMWMRLRDALARDEVVILQGDRVMPGQKGQRVPFCGGHLLLPSGPVKLALASGAPIVPIFTLRGEGKKVRIIIEEPIIVTDADEALAKFAAMLERYVQRYPDQWLVLEHAFCEDIDLACQKEGA